MNAKKYLVMVRGDEYSDEAHYPTETAEISGQYDTLKAAKAVVVGLQRSLFNEIDELSEIGSVFDDGGDSVIEFFSKKLNTDIDDIEEVSPSHIKNLKDSEVMSLARKVDYVAAYVMELEEDDTVFVVWDLEQEKPMLDYQEGWVGLISAESEDKAVKLAAKAEFIDLDLLGSYEELSDSPDLLQAFVESSEGLKYNKRTKGIEIKTKFTAAEVKALNDLLKTPKFEIRQFSVDDVLKIQDEVNG